MKHILARGNRSLLAQFAWSNVLLGFDFDGTLAPIVSDPAKAQLRAKTRALLGKVCGLYPCVVISGRARRDVNARVKGVGVREVVGNHGSEPWGQADKLRHEVKRWLPLLHRSLDAFRGVVIEDKQLTVAIHYRASREKKKVKAAIARAVDRLGKVRVIGGKQVVNVLPEGAPHKGTALERARSAHHCDTAIFVGDDETDEDVFNLDQPGQLITVRIGARASSAAAFCLRNQREVDDLLAELVRLRRP